LRGVPPTESAQSENNSRGYVVCNYEAKEGKLTRGVVRITVVWCTERLVGDKAALFLKESLLFGCLWCS